MNSRTALLAGATGLIGSQLLPLLLASERYSRVTVIGRRPVALTHPKLNNQVVDFDNLALSATLLAADDIYCCLGTTMKEAGSREAFRKVDYEYPLALARLAREQGALQYSLVSAIGANRASRYFYNRTKGEVEDDTSSINYKSIHIYRPSLLKGPRASSRLGESTANVFGTAFSLLVPKRYRPIKSIKVARAMLSYASREEDGIYFHPSDTLQGFKA
jgi:uncharacterized protein YbjT (DUF2867 family)